MNKQLLSIFLSICLTGGGVGLALEKPGTPHPAKDPAEDASRRIAAETAAAIKALGATPATKQIAAIVFKAVRSSPDSVLWIVDAAVRVSPLTAAPEIVTAATSAVPNPWKQVIYRRLADLEARSSGADRSRGPDGAGIPMTLAEAIIRTAFDARPGLSFPELQAAVNAALRMDPTILMRDIQSPRAGDYQSDPPLAPKQPAVSR